MGRRRLLAWPQPPFAKGDRVRVLPARDASHLLRTQLDDGTMTHVFDVPLPAKATVVRCDAHHENMVQASGYAMSSSGPVSLPSVNRSSFRWDVLVRLDDSGGEAIASPHRLEPLDAVERLAELDE